MADVSTLFELLADRHRRRVLFELCRSESLQVPDDVRPTGEVPTTRSPDATGGPSPPGTRSARSFAVELHHRHLPKLVDAGLVDWDRETGTVTRGSAFDASEPLLRLLADNTEAFPETTH